MTLLYPWVLSFWFLYPLCLRFCQERQPIIAFGNLAMLKGFASKGTNPRHWILGILLFLLLLALASPVKRQVHHRSESQGYEIALLLDVSYSMRDDRRFEEAKKILEKFIKRRRGDKLALEVFADKAALVAPMSADHKGLLRILHALSPGVAGGRETALYEALYRSVDLFDPDYKGKKFVILLTDGIDTAASVPLEIARRRLQDAGMHLFTVGVGSDYRRRLLEELSHANHGSFFAAQDPKELSAIYRSIDRQIKQRLQKYETITTEPLYRWPLAAALLLLLWLLLREKSTLRRIGAAFASLLLVGALFLPLPDRDSSTKHPPTLLILLDLSRSMQAKDLPPNRLEWAKSRILDLLQKLPDARIGILGFARQAYLIAPPTRNRKALSWLIRHLPSQPKLKEGSDLSEAIRQGAAMLSDSSKKVLLLLSDGGEETRYEALASELRKRKIPVFSYTTATKKGAPIPKEGGWLEDPASGAVVISRSNPSLERLAQITGALFAPWDRWSSLQKGLEEFLQNPAQIHSEQRHSVQILLVLALGILLFSYFAPTRIVGRKR